ncbi:MAG TPA: hypothetical protein PKA13_13790 [Geminicoccaceae bacterium]|nr:hypothetical protein [Geminicoccus sp.]HMU50842.1 hypothetical protein [Geminicoccaceae bacterium]
MDCIEGDGKACLARGLLATSPGPSAGSGDIIPTVPDSGRATAPCNIETGRHVPDDAILEADTGDAAKFGQHRLAVGTGIHVRVCRIQRDRLVCIENQRPSARHVLRHIECVAALQGSQANCGIQSERNAPFSGRRASGSLQQLLGRFVKRIGLAVVTKHVPHRGPPAAGAKQVGYLHECRIFVEPMKSRGADAEVKGFRFQRCVLERGNHDRQRLVGIVRAQEISQAPIRLYGHKWGGAEFEQPVRRGTGACPDLEDCSVAAQAASGSERVVHPRGIARPRAMVACGVLSESLTAKRLRKPGGSHFRRPSAFLQRSSGRKTFAGSSNSGPAVRLCREGRATGPAR